MKKLFLYVVVAAIVALATVNLSLAFKNESKVANLTMLGTESLAQGENGDFGHCQTEGIMELTDCPWVIWMACNFSKGYDPWCLDGVKIVWCNGDEEGSWDGTYCPNIIK